MKIARLKTVLEVLENYGDEDISSEHDIIYIGGPPPEDVGTIHAQVLDNAGAFWDNELDCWAVFT